MCAVGRPPVVRGVKHNQLLGLFFARYLVWLIGPIERLLVGRVSPNAITTVSLLLCVLTGVAAATGHLAGAMWMFTVAGILDILDGRLARLTNQTTQSGALYDSVSDRWGELAVFTGYAWLLRDTPWMLAVLGGLGSSMMVSYTRARAEGLGLDLHGGMMQRAERILLVVSGTLAAAWFNARPDTAYLATPILGGTMLVCALGSFGTAINRWIVAYRELAVRDAAAAPSKPKQPLAPVAQPSTQPHFAAVPVPAKLRESAELAPAAPRL
jgi:phosphatidylglycerophosphate synthase